jgi:hypothetical protein
MRWVPRKRVVVITLVMSAILLFAMRSLDTPLRTRTAPGGIVSFELAKNYAGLSFSNFIWLGFGCGAIVSRTHRIPDSQRR